MATLVSPPATSAHVRTIMQKNKAKDTNPELRFRTELFHMGIIGYRKHRADIPGKPDIAFIGRRIAIFINGCFWHKCPKCKISYPTTNQAYWREKINRNTKRDERILRELRQLDWKPIVIWECQLRRDAASCAQKIYRALAEATK